MPPSHRLWLQRTPWLLLVLVGAAGLALAPAYAANTCSFVPGSPTVTSLSGSAGGASQTSVDKMAVGDLNGDGVPDGVFAKTTSSPYNVRVFLSPHPATAIDLYTSMPNNIQGVGVIDTDGDGHNDVVVGVWKTPPDPKYYVHVFRGDGAGAFDGPHIFTNGTYVTTLVTDQDLNGDGVFDLIISGWSFLDAGSGSSVWLSDPAPPHALVPQPTLVGVSGGAVKDVVDVTGDGTKDLVMGSFSSATDAFYVVPNPPEAPGNFSSGPDDMFLLLTTPVDVSYVDITHLDDDGIIDAAYLSGGFVFFAFGVINATSGHPTLLYTAVPHTRPFAGSSITNFVLYDYTNTGVLDILFVRSYSLFLALGKGDGSFLPPSELHEVANTFADPLLFIFTADPDGDGRDAVFFGTQWTGRLFMLPEFEALPHTEVNIFSSGVSVYSLHVADLASDGNPKIIFAGNDPNELVVASWDAQSKSVDYTAVPTGLEVDSIASFDVSGDGALDILVERSGTVYALLALNDGTFAGQVPLAVVSFAIFDIISADINLDGLPDLVLLGRSYTGKVAAVFGRPDAAISGLFIDSTPTLLFSYASTDTREPNLVDADTDGVPDFMWGSSSQLMIARGHGDGTFAAPVRLGATSIAADAVWLAWGDLRTGSGAGPLQHDLVVVTDAGGVDIHPYLSPGEWGPADRVYTGSTYLVTAYVIDFDRDGRMDIVLGSSFTNDKFTYLLRTDSSFTPVIDTASSATNTVLTLDFNQDGYQDVVLRSGDYASFYGGRVLLDVPGVGVQPTRTLTVGPGASLLDAHAALALQAECFAKTVTFDTPPTPRCAADDFLDIPTGARWTIDGGGFATSCGHDGGVLFSVPTSASLTVKDLSLANGTYGTATRASSFMRVSGAGSKLVLDSVSVSGVSNAGAPPLQLYSGLGAVVSVVDGGSLTLTQSALTANTASVSGGAVALIGAGSSLDATNTSFVGNVAGGASGGGGAVVAMGSGATAVLAGCVLHDNSAAGAGGALYTTSSAEGSSIRVVDTRIEGSRAGIAGGAVAVEASPLGTAPEVVLGSGVRVAGSSAPFGGTAATFEDGFLADMAGLLVSADVDASLVGAARLLPRSQFPVASTALTLDGCVVEDSSGTYGGFAFGCGVPLNVTDTTGLEGPFYAEVGGGGTFTCHAAGALPGPVELAAGAWSDAATTGWVNVPDAPVGLVMSAGSAWGDRAATPTATLRVTAPGAAGVSGVELGGGIVEAVDGYSNVVHETGTVLGVSTLTGGAVVQGAELGIAMDPVTGAGKLDGISVFAVFPGQDVETQVLLSMTEQGRVGAQNPPTGQVLLTVTACPVGMGASSSGDPSTTALVCSPCLPGLYSSSLGVETCTPYPTCLTNSVRYGVSNASFVADCECVPGAWAPSLARPDVCVLCPKGGVCAGRLARPISAPGFESGPASSPGLFLECPQPSACAGDGQCAAGYTSRLCAECARGWYRLGSECRRCKSGSNVAVLTILVVAVVAVLSMLYAVNLAEGLKYSFAAAMIGLNGLQLSAMYGKLDLEWGEFAEVYFDVASVLNVNMELTSPECNVSNGVDVWVLKLGLVLCLPVIVALLLVCIGGVFAGARACGVGFFSRKNLAQLWSAGVRTMFQTTVLLYLPLATAAFSPFGCRRDDSGRWTMTADPARSCYTGAWWSGLFPIGLAGVLVYGLGVPLGVVWVLYSQRKRMDPVMFVLRFGFLVGRFLDSKWWFESAIMFRKLAFVMAITLFATDASKAVIAFMVLIGSLGHLLAALPYAAQYHNVTAVVVLSAVGTTLFGGITHNHGLRMTCIVAGIAVNILAIVAGNVWDIVVIVRSQAESESESKWESTHGIDVADSDAQSLHAMTDSAEVLIVETPGTLILSDNGVPSSFGSSIQGSV